MIFYTLQGPRYQLEIHEDKIILLRRPLFRLPFSSRRVNAWEITNLSSFQITVPKFLIFSGKLQWETFSGDIGMFRFSTTPAMVKKIETYLQKRVIKNHQALFKSNNKSKSERPKKNTTLAA